ncbi:hypothetical protein UFOVP1311_41 [uncultured Caudovirales phage]|jgi:hypothetical protein|uniref:Uncharacterized protein n=1 Tax=uncultured Caudovirales phage TaxID=2100421 RepID=A0A6J5RW99_9CAUD|nr:hypothetical protein UFOVP1311_41 [uncultured Caudovirales phage]
MKKNKKTTLSIETLVETLRKQTNSVCLTVNMVDKDSDIVSMSSTLEDKFIINMAMDHLMHLLENDNGRAERLGFETLENSYLEICDKNLFLRLKEKMDKISKLIFIETNL